MDSREDSRRPTTPGEQIRPTNLPPSHTQPMESSPRTCSYVLSLDTFKEDVSGIIHHWLIQSSNTDTILLFRDELTNIKKWSIWWCSHRSINKRPNTRANNPCRKGKLVPGRRRIALGLNVFTKWRIWTIWFWSYSRDKYSKYTWSSVNRLDQYDEEREVPTCR